MQTLGHSPMCHRQARNTIFYFEDVLDLTRASCQGSSLIDHPATTIHQEG